MTHEEMMAALAAPFPARDVEWRVQNTMKEQNRGMAVPYIDSRAIQNRLDQVVGIFNWKTEYRPWHQVAKSEQQANAKGGQRINASQLCGLSIYCEDRQEWIEKWDGAENSDIEPVKGGISDSFKRAAVLWNIGRYLYSLEPVWVDVEPRGRSFVIAPKEYAKLDREYEAAVQSIFGSVPASAPRQTGNQPSTGQTAPKATSPKQTPTKAAPPKQTTQRSAPAKLPAAPSKGSAIPFDYAVKSATVKTFSSGKGMVVVLHDPKTTKNVTAYLQGEYPEIAEGVCLRQVKLSRHDGPNPFNTLDSFQVAA